jgi:hypothetical protein
MGGFSRITGVFFEPGKTFEDIGRRPSWFLPLLLTVLAVIGYNLSYGQHVGWDQFMRQQAAMSPRAAERMAQATPEQLAMQAKITGISQYVFPIVMFPIIMLVSTALVLGMTAMMSAGLRFKQVFAIVCFASMPTVIRYVLAIAVVFLKKPEDFNFMNPLAFNLAAFMDPLSSPRFLYTLAVTFDVFAIWTITLTAIGLVAAAGRKRLSFGGALFAVLTPWLVFGLLAAGLAAAFS